MTPECSLAEHSYLCIVYPLYYDQGGVKKTDCHESRLNYAKAQLEQHIHDMYAEDIDRWLDELSKEQKIISWLKSLKNEV